MMLIVEYCLWATKSVAFQNRDNGNYKATLIITKYEIMKIIIGEGRYIFFVY